MATNKINNYKLIFGYLGLFIAIVGCIVLLPLLLIPFLNIFGEGVMERDGSLWYAFVIPGISAIGIGLTLYFFLFYKKKNVQLENRRDSILFLFIWIVAVIISSIPYLFVGFNFFESVFEAVSGYATAGLTVFGPNELNPDWKGYYLFTFYRSLTLLVGGVGLILVASSIIREKYAPKLYNNEGHTNIIIPNLGKTSRVILTLYFSYILFGILGYLAFGMNLFDAINHSISAVSTGGFSTHPDSIAYYANNNIGVPLGIEIITIILMICGGSNFMIMFSLFTFKLKNVFKDIEFRFSIILLAILVPIYTLALFFTFRDANISFLESMRYGIFMLFSMFSTTGLSNIPTWLNFNQLLYTPIFIIFLVIVVVGAGSESTSGGIKQFRVAIIIKNLQWHLANKLNAKKMIVTNQVDRIGKRVVISDKECTDITAYAMFYIIFIIIGSFLLGLSLLNTSFDFVSILYEFCNALGCTGLGAGITAKGQNIFALIILTLAMFFGRLEVVSPLNAITRLGRDIVKKD